MGISRETAAESSDWIGRHVGPSYTIESARRQRPAAEITKCCGFC